MTLKFRYWILVISLTLVSCNLTMLGPVTSPPSTPKPATPPKASATPTIIPIETLLARDTSTPVSTVTPSIVLASPKYQPVNCRYGPGVSYAVVGALIVGRRAEIIGKNIDATWWYVKNPNDPSTACWLSADFVLVDGNTEALPVARPPEIGVSSIEVQVDPILMNVGCASFPQTVNVTAQITTNGPAIVTWRWEVSNGDSFAGEALLFETQGVKEVKRTVHVWSVNDYRVSLHVLSPNDRIEGANFKVTCVP